MISNKTYGLSYNYIEGAYKYRGIYYIMVCGDNSEDINNLCKILKKEAKQI